MEQTGSCTLAKVVEEGLPEQRVHGLENLPKQRSRVRMLWPKGIVTVKALSQNKLACCRNRSDQCLINKWVAVGAR